MLTVYASTADLGRPTPNVSADIRKASSESGGQRRGWTYFCSSLQDKKVRTQINADENLKAVFNGKKSVSMFEMTKLVSGHVKK
jgi:hypothetical protein